MAVLCCLSFQILYGPNKDIRGEFGSFAQVHINFHTCHWIVFVIDMIYLSTAIVLSPGGNSTAHIYKQNNTNNKWTTQIKTNLEYCGPCPVFASFTLAFTLQPRKEHGKTSVRGCCSATVLLFVRHCFTVLSNKWDRFWIRHVREETKDMTIATAHYRLTHSTTTSTLQFNNVHLQRHVFYRNCIGSLNRKLISTEQRRK
jgi:hypothetical protein